MQGNARSSYFVSINADGRYVAFASDASNLMSGDTNGKTDVFVRDREQGTTERVSVGGGGTEANDSSDFPAISADGRYVAFQSFTTNFTPEGGTISQIFLRDRLLGTTELVSQDRQGGAGNLHSSDPSISADGRYVAFYSHASDLVAGDTNGAADIFLRDRQQGVTERISVGPGGVQGNNGSFTSRISSNARYITFSSTASNLVSGDTNGATDVFLRDRQQGTTERVSVGSGSTEGNGPSGISSLSNDGRYIAFTSTASNLTPGDTNGARDIYLRDRQQGTTERMNLSSGGAQANYSSDLPSLSGDGRFLAYHSDATTLVPESTNGSWNVYLVDRQAAPGQLQATVVSSTRLRLDWVDGQSDETGFLVQRRTGTGTWVSVAGLPANTTSYVNTNLSPSTQYTYRVRGNVAVGAAAFSAEASATTPPVAPLAAPANLRMAGQSESAITLIWEDPSLVDESGFELYRATAGSAWTLLRTLPPNTLRHTDGSLTSNTRYSYYLRAISPFGNSRASNSVAITTRPMAPTNFTARAMSVEKIRMTWSSGSPGAVSYQLQRRIPGGGWAILATRVGVGVITYDDAGLPPGRSYEYRILAYNADGNTNSGWVTTSATTLPLAPTNVVANRLSASAIRLTWTDNTVGELRFEVYRYGGGVGYQLVASPAANATSYTDPGLLPNTRYVYYLRTINAGGSSGNSSTSAATTAP